MSGQLAARKGTLANQKKIIPDKNTRTTEFRDKRHTVHSNSQKKNCPERMPEMSYSGWSIIRVRMCVDNARTKSPKLEKKVMPPFMGLFHDHSFLKSNELCPSDSSHGHNSKASRTWREAKGLCATVEVRSSVSCSARLCPCARGRTWVWWCSWYSTTEWGRGSNCRCANGQTFVY